MRLPRAAKARIDAAKVRDYLLSTDHVRGRYKAAFFASLGYSRKGWPLLVADLRALAASERARLVGRSEYGRKFEVRGSLGGPNGRRAAIVTVWIVREGEGVPRFVTAYPAESS